MEKPLFTKDQLVSATLAAKSFGEIRKRAKTAPLFITENGDIDTVMIDYEQYESMYIRLKEFEEARLLENRIEQLDDNPSLGIPWDQVRRTGQNEVIQSAGGSGIEKGQF